MIIFIKNKIRLGENILEHLIGKEHHIIEIIFSIEKIKYELYHRPLKWLFQFIFNGRTFSIGGF